MSLLEQLEHEMNRRYPEIGMRRSNLTPPRNQEYFCPVCEQEIKLAPAYGSWALRPVLSYLTTRFHKHMDHHHPESTGETT